MDNQQETNDCNHNLVGSSETTREKYFDYIESKFILNKNEVNF